MVRYIDINYFFFYKEGRLLFISSFIGSLKSKASFFFLKNNNFLFFLKLSSNYKYKFLSFLDFLMISLRFGFRLKYKIKGLGYKAFFEDQAFIFKLGYSHPVNFLLPLPTISRNKIKKKRFYTLRGIDLLDINKNFRVISSFRNIDLYSRNGISNRIRYISFKHLNNKL